jgi:hypothetical protein
MGSDFIEDHIIEDLLFEDHDATVDNESGHMDGSVWTLLILFLQMKRQTRTNVSRTRRKGPTIKTHKHRRMNKQNNRMTMLMIMECLT